MLFDYGPDFGADMWGGGGFVVFFFSLLQISFCLIFFIALSNKINNLFVSVALIRLVVYLTKDNFIKINYSVLSSLIK